MTRAEVVDERVERLIAEFSKYVDAYDRLGPFSSDQLKAHLTTIRLRHKAGSVAAALASERFIASLWLTLQAWRLGTRGSVLAPLERFVDVLRAAEPSIAAFEAATIDDPRTGATATAERLWMTISSLGIVDNKAKLVAGTKALHHILPDLVVPMDRQWTGMFFGWHMPEWQDPANQRRILLRSYERFVLIARRCDPAAYVGKGWRSSRTKIIDDALIGYCKVELEAGRAAPRGGFS